MANAGWVLDFDPTCINSTVGRLGGCHYAPGARGQSCDLVAGGGRHRSGHETEIDPDALKEAEQIVAGMRVTPGDRPP